jgi:amino acid transporter
MSALRRRLNFRSATAANMLAMVGVGPFLTIPLLLATMNGPQAMLGWIVGAIVVVCDGLAWSELGAAIPESGGPYRYFGEVFNRRDTGRGPGQLLSFLFLWQLVVSAPILLASGSVGFAQYALYLWPSMTPLQGKLIAVAVSLIACAVIYRRIEGIGRLSIAIWCVVMMTLLWVVIDGLAHARLNLITDLPPDGWHLNRKFWMGLGGATLFAAYDYSGYTTVCFVGGEVQNPARNIPWSILSAILLTCALYLTMNFTIIGVVPWREAIHSQFIVSDFMARLHGPRIAGFMTILILVTAFASVFAGMLGFSRVPFAAAAEGHFFKFFAHLHPREGFPSFSVLLLGVTTAIASLLDLDALVKACTVIQTMIQSLAVVAAALLLRRLRPDIKRPFRMWLYPVPAIVAIAGWCYIIATSGIAYILSSFALLAVGIASYLWKAKAASNWPWSEKASASYTQSG